MNPQPILQAGLLVMIAASGLGVVLVRTPIMQTIALGYFGLLLAVMFFAFQAPDVALSQITIGAVALPLMVMLTLARMKRDEK